MAEVLAIADGACLRRLADALDAGSPAGALAEADMQRAAGLVVAFFGARFEEGRPAQALCPAIDTPTTAGLVTASALLAACEVELFELGMWRTFSGCR